MRQKKSFIAIGLVLILSIIGVLVHRLAFAKETTAYRFATIERGNLQSTVSATGTLNAVTTVSVGTQVSGQVSELLADFNDHVKKGQLLARIDPTLALAAVTDAQANLELTNDGLVARSAYEVSQSGATVADAGVKSARVALDRARQNLSYTNIYAPIDGVVVERNVQQGQTVAASLSAPQLFLIANDLSQMQILAQVGESDIAQIKEAQPVSFTVQALTGQTFKGTVKQVRLQSTTTDNVVNYTVVVSVTNTDGKLLPGMTARVQFLTKQADNVLKVSNSALRYKPTDAELAALKAAKQATSTTSTATSTARSGRNGGARTGSNNFGTLYYLDATGKLAVARVKTGINDGSTTEVTGKTIKEGMQVIAGTITPTTTVTATSTAPATPFQGSQQQQGGAQRGGGGRGGF